MGKMKGIRIMRTKKPGENTKEEREEMQCDINHRTHSTPWIVKAHGEADTETQVGNDQRVKRK